MLEITNFNKKKIIFLPLNNQNVQQYKKSFEIGHSIMSQSPNMWYIDKKGARCERILIGRVRMDVSGKFIKIAK